MKKAKKIIVTILVLTMLMSLGALSVSAAGKIAYGAGTVSATSLNIRSGPGMDYSIVGSIPNGCITVIIEKTNDTWYEVNYLGKTGYVNASYLKNILVAENFYASGTVSGSGVRMRSTPSTSSSILGTYGNGTVMNVIGINNGWYKVQYSGNTGYIRSDLMNITGASSASSKSSSGFSSSSGSSLGEQIANFALQYVGYSYVYGAESPSVGFDCSGLVYYVYGEYGYSLSRTASQQYKNNGTSVAKSDLKPGDLVFFSSNGGVSVTHVGIYIGNDQFVHASTSSVGVITSSLTSSYYTSVWFGAKRIV